MSPVPEHPRGDQFLVRLALCCGKGEKQDPKTPSELCYELMYVLWPQVQKFSSLADDVGQDGSALSLKLT